MAESPVSVLFGDSNWEKFPWYQYDCCKVRQVDQAALDFLHMTIGLHGDLHDEHGYIVDMDSFAALVRNVHWCHEQKLDFLCHVAMVQEGDAYYTELATSKLNDFLKATKVQ